MTVSTIALYASPPSSVCSTPHPCHINTHASYDFELGSRSSSSSSSAAASTSQKPVVMSGLSRLFSSPAAAKHSPLSSFSGSGEELGSLWHDRGEELKEFSSSFSYSSSKFHGSWKRDNSPVSVFQGPVSCSSSGVSGSSRSSPMRIGCDSSIRLDGFMRNALGSCLDYDSPSSEADLGSSSSLVDELTFNLEDSFVEGTCEPYAKELLVGAQLRHKIFCEEFVIKAFYEAEKAHRGQVYNRSVQT